MATQERGHSNQPRVDSEIYSNRYFFVIHFQRIAKHQLHFKTKIVFKNIFLPRARVMSK